VIEGEDEDEDEDEDEEDEEPTYLDGLLLFTLELTFEFTLALLFILEALFTLL
jgi:hypothetical protein